MPDRPLVPEPSDIRAPRLQAAFDQSPLGFAIVSPRGEWHEANDRFCELTHSSRAELPRLRWSDLFNPQDLVPDAPALQALLSGATPCYITEKRFARPAFGTRWARLVFSRVHAEGQPDTLFLCLSEITDRKEALATLQRTQERYRTLLTAFPGGFLIFYGTDLRVQVAGGQGLSRLRLSPTELEGRFVRDAIPSDMAQCVEPLLKNALEGRSSRAEYTLHGLWFDVHVSPVRGTDDVIVGGMAIGLDVTERRKSESESLRLLGLYENTCDMVFIADLNLNILHMNRAARRRTGQPATGPFSPFSLARLHPADNGSILLEQAVPIALREGCWHGENLFVEPVTGKRIPVSQVVAAHGTAREPTRFISTILRDISPLREREERLAAEKREAEAATRTKTEFLANMSHEIRTPMNSIIGLAEVLYEKDLNDEQRYHVQSILNAGESLLHIINQILDFSKIEAGSFEFEEVPFNLRDLVEDLMTGLEPLALKKRIAARLEFAENVPCNLVGPAPALRQVLINLAHNAIRFTDDGGFTLFVTPGPALDQPERVLIRFAVSDTGIGISPENRQKLFRVFSQAHPSTLTRRYGGTGLGLAISQRLVNRLGGTIEVESQPGKGSTFAFCIPLHVAGPGSCPISRSNRPNTHQGHWRAEGLRALVVEDYPPNQEVMFLQLRSLGFEVDLAPNGHSGIEMALARNYDVILMDVQMPDITGLDAVREIRRRADGATPLPPIIAITAHAMSSEREACLAAGLDDYLAKPFRKQELIELLRRWNLLASPDQEPVQEPGESTLDYLVQEVGRESTAQLVATFIQSAAESVRLLKAAADRRDLEVVCAEAHKLKGSSALYSATTLSEMALPLSRPARRPTPTKPSLSHPPSSLNSNACASNSSTPGSTDARHHPCPKAQKSRGVPL